MKLTTFFLLISLASIASTGYSQSEKVSVQMQNAKLKDFFRTIEQQTDYKFLYRDDVIDNIQVNINESDKPLDDILTQVFYGSDFSFKVMPNNLIVIAPLSILQQSIITGTITDEEQNPMPGVNILIEGTTIGAISDMSGKYQITLPDGNGILVFTFIGYDPQRVPVAGKKVIDISLVPALSRLDEVVVVGYGTARKSDLTGSISALKQDEYKNQPVSRVDQILQGRTAGVMVTSNSGAPGGTSSIRIRGANSINGNNDPLYVIDGFVGASFEDVNPTDIETIQVLKDASSTAIYGSRGSNGVVLITTKSGASGKPKLSFTSRFITSSIINKWDIMDAGTFAQTANDRADALGTSRKFTDAQIADFKANGGTVWQDEVLRVGNGQEYQLDFSGGNDRTTYFVSGNYLGQNGTFINSDYKKYSLRTNLDTKISDKFNVTLKMSFSRRENNNTGTLGGTTGSPLAQAIAWAPTTPAYDANGKLTVFDPISSIKINPIEAALNDNITEINTFNSNGGFNIQIIDGLTLDLGFGASYSNNQIKRFTLGSQINTPTASRGTNERIFLQNTNSLSYTKDFNSIHRINAVAVFETQGSVYRAYNVDANGLQFPNLKYENITLAKSLSGGATYAKETILSLIGRVNYSLMERYLLTASIRRDGSSKFRGDNKYSTFPSIGLGWRISEEEFLKGSSGFMNNLKLRASWGQTGSQGIPVYGTVTSYNTSVATATASFINGTASSGINIGNPGNQDLRWETTTQINGGFDAGFFKGRFTLEADYFVKNTTDLLLSEPLPSYAGSGSIFRNIGEVRNTGVELNLTWDIIAKSKFSWATSMNISFLSNEVTSLGDRTKIYPTTDFGGGLTNLPEMVLVPGESLSNFNGLKYLGVWQTEQAAEAAVYGRKPGDSRYEDVNGDKVIGGDDYQIVGSGIPTRVFGWNNNLSYGSFTLNAFFQSMMGFDKWNFAYGQAIIGSADAREMTHVDIANRWTPTNTGSLIPGFSTTDIPEIQTSRFIERGDYLRLKNLSLVYNLPKNFIDGISGTIQIGATNLLTFTKYTGLDPESNSGGGDSSGQDAGSYPNSRTWTFSLNLNF